MKSLTKYALSILILVLLFLTVGLQLQSNWNTYYYLPDSETAIVTEFYKGQIADLPEPIMISEPTAIAYIDKLMIPIYQDNIAGPAVYEKKKFIAKSILFHPQVYPCLEGDTGCKSINEGFFQKLNSEYILVDRFEYYGIEYFIFI